MTIKGQKRLILILSIVLVLTVIVAIFLRFSRAWFASDVDPVIYSDNMMIVSSEGLNIQLENQNETDPSIKEELNLKDVAKDITDYAMLEQLSSANGVNLFKRTDDDGLIAYDEVTDQKGYIEITILLVNSSESTDKTREVFLSDFRLQLINSEGEPITNNKCAEDALRVSMQIEDYTGGINTYIMGIDSAINANNRFDNFKGFDGNDYNEQVLKKEENYYVNYNAVYKAGVSDESYPEAIPEGMTAENCRRYQNVFYTSSFMKYINNTLNGDYISLAMIPSGKNTKVTFRLWLEGSDPRCEIPISGTKIDFYIKFGNEVIND